MDWEGPVWMWEGKAIRFGEERDVVVATDTTNIVMGMDAAAETMNAVIGLLTAGTITFTEATKRFSEVIEKTQVLAKVADEESGVWVLKQIEEDAVRAAAIAAQAELESYYRRPRQRDE
jgi:hypothetical protein